MNNHKDVTELMSGNTLESAERPDEFYERPTPPKYELIADEVVPLCNKKYANRWEAYSRFAQIAAKRKLILIGAPKECARYYSFKVLHARK